MSEKKPQHSNRFFLISFLPAIAYWYLEEKYPLRVAISGGLALAILEIALERIFTKHVHKISIFNFVLILFLGGLSLLGDEGVWFKLQPFFTGLFMGGFITFKAFRGKGFMYEMLETFNPNPPPEPVWAPIERRLGLFLLVYGCFMGSLALWGTTDQWTFFKTIGFYIVFTILMVIEGFFMRKRMKDYFAEQQELLRSRSSR
jgi:intracellular septation protein